MHLAICTEDPAERIQIERLLKRESDRISHEMETLYVDSFGTFEQMLTNPRQYDAFFLDYEKADVLPYNFLERLYQCGVRTPIVLSSSPFSDKNISYSNLEILYLEKPIKPLELSSIIQKIYSRKIVAKPLIEFRTEGETLYVTEPEILYIVRKNSFIEIHLTNNQILKTQNSIQNIFSEISHFESFFLPNSKCIINGRHIQNFKKRKAVMIDGTLFNIGFRRLCYAKYVYQKFHFDS